MIQTLMIVLTLSSIEGIPFIEFKTENEKKEFIELETKNNRLYTDIIDVSTKDCNLVITEVYRTQKEQEAIYGKNTTKKSQHQFWRAIDVRSWNLSDDCTKSVLDKLSSKGYFAFIHVVKGGAKHIHVEENMKKKPKSVVPIAKIKNQLRRVHMHCKYRKKAKDRSKIDSALFKCEAEGCNVCCYEGSSEKNYLKLVDQYKDQYEVIRGKIELDHIQPVVDIKKGFGSWDDYINDLWVDDSGYNCLCKFCHAEKTAKEAKGRAKHGSLKRKK